jgi:hypothetical protein
MNTTKTAGRQTAIAATSRDARWAQRWFAGHATCPVCGSEQLAITGAHTHVGGETRVEWWKCKAAACEGRWHVELRESAVAVFDSRTNSTRQRHERVAFERRPTFQIEVEDGVAKGVRMAVGSDLPRPAPRFVLREYESDGSIERDRLSGIDARGLEYFEHELEMLDSSG